MCVALTGCSKTERWCEFDNDRDPEVVVENWKCELGMPDHEWEPESDKPKYKFKPNKTKKPATVLMQTVPPTTTARPTPAAPPTKKVPPQTRKPAPTKR